MTTIKEFHKQFEDTEGRLVDMLCAPCGNVPLITKQCLKELYKIKQELFTIFLNPNPDSIIELFFPNYALIKNFVNENYRISSEKHTILENKGRGLRFDNTKEKDLKFFVEGGYVQR